MGRDQGSLPSTVSLPRLADYPLYWAEHTPAADAIVDADGSVSYADLAVSIDRMACGLLAAGVRPGHRVATVAPPSRLHLMAFLASARVGAVWVGLNPRYTRSEITRAVTQAGPTVLIAVDAAVAKLDADDLQAAAAAVPTMSTVVAGPDLVAAFGPDCSLDRFLAAGAVVPPADLRAIATAVEGDDPVLLVFTSGTSGVPKGALLSHRAVITSARIQSEHWWAQPFRILNNVPINHIGGAVQLACQALVMGGANVVVPKFDPATTPALIERHGVTVLHQVPTMYRMILDAGRPSTEQMAGVQALVWSGAPCPAGMVAELRALCPRLYTSYGQTESGGEVLYTAEGASDGTLAASVGAPDGRVEVRLSDDGGSLVGDADVSVGELQVRGPTVMLGYLDNPEATADAFTADGWLRTGDLGAIGLDGSYRIVGRLKEMFKSGGHNVYPREVEDALEAHPAVGLAAVVPAADELYGEVGVAWVLAAEPVGADDLMRHCRGVLANYKVPKHIHVRDELPMLPIGKIDKAALRAEA